MRPNQLLFMLCAAAALLFVYPSCGPDETSQSETTSEQPSNTGEISVETSGQDAAKESAKESALDAGAAPEETTSPDDAQRPELEPDTTPDKGQPNPDKPRLASLTWWQCRQKQNSLSKEEKSFCDKHYTQPPTALKYGIRWVFLYDTQQAQTWIKQRLSLLNERFKPAKISFHTHSITVLGKTSLATNGVYDNRKRYKLSQLKYELIELLDLNSSATEEAALQAFQRMLRDAGADSQAVSAMKLDNSLQPNAFLNRVARALEQEIFVFVAQTLVTTRGTTPGGYASLPGYNHTSIFRGSVYLKANYRADALAHEVGHYLGLVHTQATTEIYNLQSAYTGACKPFLPQGNNSLIAVLKKNLGPNYQKPLGQPFVSYKGTSQQLRDFRALRCAMSRMWISRINTFQKTNESDAKTWKSFSNFGEFAKHVFGGGKAYEKLFSKQVNGRTRYNCQLNTPSNKVECTYGSNKFLGDSSLLLNSIAFDKGQASNLMSYLNNPRAFPVRLLAPEQLEVMLLHTRTAERMALRNYLIQP